MVVKPSGDGSLTAEDVQTFLYQYAALVGCEKLRPTSARHEESRCDRRYGTGPSIRRTAKIHLFAMNCYRYGGVAVFVGATVSSVLAGCASGSLAGRGFYVVSVTYQYTDENRVAREWRALLTAQDECYTGGFQYAQPTGPPQIISDGGITTEHRATRSFYCIGFRGEG